MYVQVYLAVLNEVIQTNYVILKNAITKQN
jgi:hypothetical protein